MSKPEIRAYGGTDLAYAFGRLSRRVKGQVVRDALKAGGGKMRTAMRAEFRKIPGRKTKRRQKLTNLINLKVYRSQDLRNAHARVGATATLRHFAHIVEFGGGRQTARRFMEKALRSGGDDAVEALRREFAKAITRQVRRVLTKFGPKVRNRAQ